MWSKIKNIIKKSWSWIRPYLTPKMLPIILIVYSCTNLIWYAIAFAPFTWIPDWLSGFAKGYLVFLYTPWAPEKILIVFISGKLYKIIYKEKFEKKEVQNA